LSESWGLLRNQIWTSFWNPEINRNSWLILRLRLKFRLRLRFIHRFWSNSFINSRSFVIDSVWNDHVRIQSPLKILTHCDHKNFLWLRFKDYFIDLFGPFL
jgi:hypothetical protein